MTTSHLSALLTALSIEEVPSSDYGFCRDVCFSSFFCASFFVDWYLSGGWFFVYDWTNIFNACGRLPFFNDLPVPDLSFTVSLGREVSLFKI